jgi:predicted dehydrogenase
VRFFSGREHRRVVSLSRRLQADGAETDECTLLLAELTDGALVDYRLESTPGEGGRRAVLFGTEGTLTITDEGAMLQRREDETAQVLPVPEPAQIPEGVSGSQHAVNRLVCDFVAAVRAGGREAAQAQSLPTFEDGLRVQEAIAAAERSASDRRWVDLSEMCGCN